MKTQRDKEMAEFLSSIYPWTKAFHIMSVIAWMAGIFYLPRLFVYHVESVKSDSDTDKLFQTMEYKLLKMIMNPAMIASWVFGLCLVFTPGIVDWSYVWPWAKAASVLTLTWFHIWLGMRRKDFVAGKNTLTGRQFRLMNEIPTVLMAIIVISVVVQPF